MADKRRPGSPSCQAAQGAKGGCCHRDMSALISLSPYQRYPMRLPTCTCKRCGFKWHPRVPNPKACTACNSPYWNKPRTRQAGPVARKRLARGQ